MKRVIVILILVIAVLSFLIADLFKYQYLTIEGIVGQKEFIAIIKDSITILTILLGAIFSYYRFFNGRTFSAKAEIEIDVALVAKPNKNIMHAVTVSITNIGTLSIWDPVAKVAVRNCTDDIEDKEYVVQGFGKVNYHNEQGERLTVINPGEKAYFMYWKEFEPKTWAVTYVAEVKSKNNRIWQKGKTVANKIKD